MCESLYGYDGTPFSRLRSKIIKARKRYECAVCATPILPGDLYQYTFEISDGLAYSDRSCTRCAEIRSEFESEHEVLLSHSLLIESIDHCIDESRYTKDTESEKLWSSRMGEINQRRREALAARTKKHESRKDR